jgi:hypothetical protein
MTDATLSHYIYGHSPQSSDDPFMLCINEAMENGLKAALPFSTLVASK